MELMKTEQRTVTVLLLPSLKETAYKANVLIFFTSAAALSAYLFFCVIRPFARDLELNLM